MSKRKGAINKLVERAKKAGWAVEERPDYFGQGKSAYIIDFPQGSESRRILVNKDDQAALINKYEFENIQFLPKYDAIYVPEDESIEAVFVTDKAVNPMSISLKGSARSRLSKIMWRLDENFDPYELRSDQQVHLNVKTDTGASLEISDISELLSALISDEKRRNLSLKIFIGKISRQSDRVEILEALANSLFFQLECNYGIGFVLQPTRDRRIRKRPRRSAEKREAIEIGFPIVEYDAAPMALYWYGKSASTMPMLAFLAYYQVLEFYLPSFQKSEAIKKARKILKEPNFRFDRDADLTKLILSISEGSRSSSDERTLIKIAISEIISPQQFREFCEANDDILEVIGKKQKGLTDEIIDIRRKDGDFIHKLADVLYGIRCRVVHTKNNFDNEAANIILPFSDEERKLVYFVRIMQFIAKNALIYASFPIRSLGLNAERNLEGDSSA